MAPSADLAARGVEAFWMAGNADDSVRHHVFADGSLDLIVRFRVGPEDRLHDAALLATGPMDQVRIIDVAPHALFIGARFRPGAGRVIADADMGHIARLGAVPAETIGLDLARLAARLGEVRDRDEAFRCLVGGVRHLAARSGAARHEPPSRVRTAIELLSRAHSVEGVARTARALGMTTRSLHREMTAWTGLAPKAMARVLRFGTALDRCRQSKEVTLAQIAADCGYADQAHMTREFRLLAGMTPKAVRAASVQPRMSDPFKTG